MTVFPFESVSDALEHSLKNAKHLRMRHAATVAAARALARKIDAWDLIVEWAGEDAAERGGRPSVPANDNVSIASFLKYLDALGLNPDSKEPAGAPGRPATKPAPAGQPSQPTGGVLAFRKRAQAG